MKMKDMGLDCRMGIAGTCIMMWKIHLNLDNWGHQKGNLPCLLSALVPEAMNSRDLLFRSDGRFGDRNRNGFGRLERLVLRSFSPSSLIQGSM